MSTNDQYQKHDLPGSWKWVKLNDLCQITDRDHRTPKYVEDGVPLISPKDFVDRSIDFSRLKRVHRSELDSFVKKCRPKFGDILYSRIGTIGKARKIDFDFDFVALHSLALLKPNYSAISTEWLLYLMMSPGVYGQAKENIKSVGTPDLGLKRIQQFDVPLAPYAEQIRIVSKADEIFSRIDEGERALERAQTLVVRYRQSVLKAAVTGELTRAWREQRKGKLESGEALLARILKARRSAWEKAELDKMKAKGIKPAGDAWKQKYEEPSLPDTEDLPKLPPGWTWATAETVCVSVHSGTTPERDFLSAIQQDGVPFIKVYNLTMDGVLDFTISPTFVEANYHEKKMVRSHTYPGDVLTNIVGPPLGKVSVVPSTFPEWNINQAVAAFRVSSWLSNAFLSTYLQTEIAKSWLRSTAKTTTSQVNLAITTCRRLPVPVPPLDEQAHICDLMEKANSDIASVMHALNAGAMRSIALRQATLKSAFSGQLVPQNANDEPASALLERIAAGGQESRAAKSIRGRKPGRKPK